MSEYVGLVQGKVHDRREMSEYYCGGCGWPVTDHDSYCRECGGELHKGADNSRWHELFGTPERAARTLLYVLNCKDSRPWVSCDSCPILDGCKIRGGDCDAILEWLRGDAL